MRAGRTALGGRIWLSALLLILGCERRNEDKTLPAKRATPVSLEAPPKPLAPPIDVFVVDHTAYGASLGFSGRDLVLLTTEAAYVASPGGKPERFPHAFGAHRVLAGEKVYFWEKNGFFAVPLRGGEKKEIGKAGREPSLLAHANEHLVWVEKDEAGTSSLFALGEKRPRLLHRTTNAIVALEGLGLSAFFVEVEAKGAFRIGRVDVLAKDSEKVEWAPARTGRPPSMLAVGESLFYYDGAARSVRRLTPDFVIDEKVAEKIVCSPIAAKRGVFCANVGGVFALEEGRLRPLLTAPRGPVAALTVSDEYVAFVNDAGENKLVVRVVDLSR